MIKITNFDPSMHTSSVIFSRRSFYNLKRVNCEIRPGRPNGPIGKPNMPTSTCPKKVGPILSHGPPVRTKAQTCPSRFKKLVLQAWEACPASLREACSSGLRGLLSKSVRLALQGKEAGPHYYKKAPTPSKKVCVTNSSLAL